MDHQRFDTLTRGLAARGTRRSVLRGFTGLTAASLAFVGLGHQARFARALQDAGSTEEQSVILYEEMGQLAQDHAGSCEKFARKLHDFYTTHADLIEQLKAEQAAWDHDKRVRHAETYGDRREVATNRILAAFSRCRQAVPEGTPAATPAIRAWQPIATPVTPPGTEQPEAQVDGPVCASSLQMFCLNVNTFRSTDAFAVPAICTNPDDPATCSECVAGDYCGDTYPDVCPPDQCTLTYNATDYCCNNICPVSTGDCLAYAGAVYASSSSPLGPNQCMECKVGWCATTDSCQDNCQANGCCTGPCPDMRSS